MPRANRIALLFAWVVAIACYCSGAASIPYSISQFEGFAWAAQVAAFAVGWSVLILSFRERLVRISNAGVLAFGWFTVYLLYPSYQLLKGNPFLLGYVQYGGDVARVFLYHAEFVLGFAFVYAFFNLKISEQNVILQRREIRAGRLLTVLAMAPLVVETVTRLLSGQGFFRTQEYGESWAATTDYYANAMQAGGILRIFAQIQSKVWFLVILFQGTALGLLLADARTDRLRRVGNLLLVGGFVVASLTLGNGGRSAVLLTGFLALYICDRIGEPIKWRSVAIWVIIVAFLFEFYGQFRTVRSLGFADALREALVMFQGEEARFNEFTLMLIKEERGLQLYHGQLEPLKYLSTSLVSWLPGQILPWKYQFSSTAIDLSINMLGAEAAAAGSGVAGAMIVDGYRFFGDFGGLVLGAILGIIWGGVQKWESGRSHFRPAVSFVAIILVGGFAVTTFTAVRGDLINVINGFVYYVLCPAAIAAITGRRWLVPVRRQMPIGMPQRPVRA